MQLISWCEPRSVMLVHGEGEKMKFLKSKIKSEHGIECFMPANGETAVIPANSSTVPATVSVALLKAEAARSGLNILLVGGGRIVVKHYFDLTWI